jgi:FAD linked oxidases, C-terminal domain
VILGTGEHGIGVGKKKYMKDELGEGTVALMWSVKKTIDPYNLFNPGKASYPPVFWQHDTERFCSFTMMWKMRSTFDL